ncbi:GlsB/YeaQ/YmgE family stress response membrane protein [Actinomadura latina]|uniref:GlsB/YeaQ/YmgE family stress response membrane protein n=1 Tax=Actinomadura latina TaxID=163603 RepID=A0A846YSQ0_9ACTN|nr:GlsB/YeaQ/YmgE family stress response membrane protein [Actinomadura latina]NKZ02787.1 GlsB/YeaQ/YmgE family stress response membrane protein [Actinomadura latina]
MGIIAWIILGLVAGVIAKALVPGRDPQGLIITTLIGVAGALLGGFLATRLFDVDGVQGFFDLSTWITAIAGSALLLLAYHLITSRRSGRGNGGRRNGQRSGRRSNSWVGRR